MGITGSDVLEELEVTWLRAATVWWAFVWRSLLIGFEVGGVRSCFADLEIGDSGRQGSGNRGQRITGSGL